jgi:hypothetical protein
MNTRRSFKFYVYTCDKHSYGSHIRDISASESKALYTFAAVVHHATNCWVQGCQEIASQVRLIKAGDE